MTLSVVHHIRCNFNRVCQTTMIKRLDARYGHPLEASPSLSGADLFNALSAWVDKQLVAGFICGLGVQLSDIMPFTSGFKEPNRIPEI